MILLKIILYFISFIIGTLVGCKLTSFIIFIRLAEVISTRLTIVLGILVLALSYSIVFIPINILIK